MIVVRIGFLHYRKDLVTLKCERLSYNTKTLREDAHSRVQGKCLFRDRARRESPQADSLFLYGRYEYVDLFLNQFTVHRINGVTREAGNLFECDDNT